jgi:2-oxoisovalerate dehydrogenase E1 component
VRRPGTGAAIVTWGTMLAAALEAADTVENVSVIDLRWLSPLDDDALRRVVLEAGGRVVVAHEANLTGGFGAEIVARLHDMLGDQLTLKVRRVASPDVRMPSAPALAQRLLPNAEKIVTAVRAVMV